MTKKDQIVYLTKKYYEGEYDTITFTDEFNRIYALELDYSSLTERENFLFSQLSLVTSRFSPFEEDFKVEGAYFNEKDVKEKVAEVYSEL